MINGPISIAIYSHLFVSYQIKLGEGFHVIMTFASECNSFSQLDFVGGKEVNQCEQIAVDIGPFIVFKSIIKSCQSC